MKTKNLFLSTAIAITALFISCNEPESPPVQPFLRLTAPVTPAPPEASQQSITLTSNVAWEVSIGDVDWITIDQMQGEGNATLRADVEANSMAEERTAVITVTSGELNRIVNITQAGTSPHLSTYPTFINADGMGNLPGGGVAYTINVTSNVRWTAEVINVELQEWISINPTSGVGDGVITVTLDQNIRFTRRHAFISFSADGIQRTDTVFQRASHSLPADEQSSVTINGITWARTNVDDFGTFVHFLDRTNPGKFFQFNRPTAYSVIDGRAEPPLKYEIIEENSDWSILNDPCPCGWRVPTRDEMANLRASGFQWINEPRGAWFGTDAQTATFDTPGNAIFLLAGGRIMYDTMMFQSSFRFSTITVSGVYWTSNQFSNRHISTAFPLMFGQQGLETFGWGLGKSFGFLVRCVAE